MSTSTSDVLSHHLTAFGEGSVEEIIKDYTEDSILLHPDGVVKGLQQITAFFTEIFKIFVPGDYSFDMKCQEVHGDVAYIVWKAETPKELKLLLRKKHKMRLAGIAENIL